MRLMQRFECSLQNSKLFSWAQNSAVLWLRGEDVIATTCKVKIDNSKTPQVGEGGREGGREAGFGEKKIWLKTQMDSWYGESNYCTLPFSSKHLLWSDAFCSFEARFGFTATLHAPRWGYTVPEAQEWSGERILRLRLVAALRGLPGSFTSASSNAG